MARALALLCLLASVPFAPAFAAEGDADAPPLPSAEAARARWHGRLDGRHFHAVVRLSIARDARSEERRLEVWRDDANGVRERLLARFAEPPDLRGLGLLYLEGPGGANDYFVYQPSLRRVRRVPESVVRDDVYGVDLEFLGFGVAPLEPTEPLALDGGVLEGRPALRLRERASRANARFDERVVWLDAKTFVPLRTEHWRGGRRVLVARTGDVSLVQGVPTPARVVFERPGESVTLTIERVDYEAPIPPSFFSAMALVK